VLVEVSANGSASERNLTVGILDVVNDGEKVEGRADEAVYSRRRHHFAGSETFQHAQRSACEPRAFSR
jgi:hypothetical protein